MPTKQSAQAAGFDVYAALDNPMTLKPGERAAIPTGLKIEVPEGYLLSVRPRSGLAIRNGIGLVNSPGTIDSDYRGEVKVLMVNLSNESHEFENGDRIAQFLLEKMVSAMWTEVPAEELSTTDRGEGGFGSTG